MYFEDEEAVMGDEAFLQDSRQRDEEFMIFKYNRDKLRYFWNTISSIRECEWNWSPLNPNVGSDRERLSPQERRIYAIQAVQACIREQIQDLLSGQNPTFYSPNRKDWNYVQYDPSYGLVPVEDSLMALGAVKTSLYVRGSQNKYTKIMFVLQMILKLLMDDTRATQRDMYYQRAKDFKNQHELNESLFVISSMLQISRYDLHILTTSKGLIYGDFNYVDPDNFHLVDCRKSVTNVPDNVLGIRQMSSNAKLCLVVEKDAVFQRLVNSNLLHIFNREVIIITGKGVPDVNTRQLLHRIYQCFKLPMFALVDGDPYGIDIMFVYKYGSLSMAWCCENMTVPALKWIGLHPTDFELMESNQALLMLKPALDMEEFLIKMYFYRISIINS
ncbi:meiotic recombination protein SPO11 isoform X2 [Lepeophtheirus salmonis]|uniref:meiotic recombination protein SPO11 isoform X2 n=1 Tax=Lepeophtheirus salmonis TaxID=72036 RepID=UPI003AF3EBE6